ncbi:hypothetical protein [Streptomyces sp. NPDC048442]|uniref:hypothetical protein n=1 Tax=Streptomyces sp. NPDC048442 TaxID=3154823 RepID=UPI0034252996
MFRRRKSDGSESRGWGRPGRSFPTRLESADRGLCFDALFTYHWVQDQAPGTTLVHGDAVARSLLRDRAAAVVRDCPLGLPADAEAAVNSVLSAEIRTDPRLVITGSVRLGVAEADLLRVRQREQAAEQLRLAAAVESARLEILRVTLLDRRLGIAWWIDKYADLQFATGDPAAKAASVLEAFHTLETAMRGDAARAEPDEASVIRGYVEQLLATLADPASGKRAIELLETVLRTLSQPSLPVGREQSA